MFWNTWQLWNPTCVQKNFLVQFAGWCCWNRNASVAPAKTYDCKSQTPKRLTTRMAGSWRDKHTQGQHVWMRRSRYVAREFAWLSPDRQDLLSPASSVLTVRHEMEVIQLCSLLRTDAFLMVEQKGLTQVTCEDAAGQTTEFILGRVLPRQRLDLRCGMNPLAQGTLLKVELGFEECEPYRWMQMFVDAARGWCSVPQHQRLLGVCLAACLESQVQDLLRKGRESRRRVHLPEEKAHVVEWEWNGCAKPSKTLGTLVNLRHIKKTTWNPNVRQDITCWMNQVKLQNGALAMQALNRSCVGVLLECYTIRGLSQCMSRPAVHALAWWTLVHVLAWMHWPLHRALVQGPLRLAYNDVNYTLEVYSDSNWTKHKTTRRSVSSEWFSSLAICFTPRPGRRRFWLWARPKPRSTLLLVIAAMVCVDVALSFICDWLRTAGEVSTLHRQCCWEGILLPLRRIRHISLRILWVQSKEWKNIFWA